MENKTVDVIIPAYHPGNEFATLIKRLEKQSVPIHRIIVMNTDYNPVDQNSLFFQSFNKCGKFISRMIGGNDHIYCFIFHSISLSVFFIPDINYALIDVW